MVRSLHTQNRQPPKIEHPISAEFGPGRPLHQQKFHHMPSGNHALRHSVVFEVQPLDGIEQLLH